MEIIENPSKVQLWTSYVIQLVIVILFVLGSCSNILQTEMAIKGASDFGIPHSSVLPLGVVLLISTCLYALPKTMTIGAILLTSWLGGAVCAHLIHNDSLTYIIIPVIFGTLIWTAVVLRSKMYKILLPL